MWIRLLSAIALAILVTGCASTVTGPEEFPTEFVNELATVREVGDGIAFFLDPSDDFSPLLVPYPKPLGEAFSQDGLRVMFSGELLPIPSDVRLSGPPVNVTEIRNMERQPTAQRHKLRSQADHGHDGITG